jgi:hypothetical protein
MANDVIQMSCVCNVPFDISYSIRKTTKTAE